MKTYPAELQDVCEGTLQNKADGRIRGAAIRSDRNTIVIDGSAVTATTSDTFSLGYPKKGQATKAFEIDTNGVNMSAASIAIGTAADPDKYLAAAALPNATTARRLVRAASVGFAPDEADTDEIIVTISGATIPNGTLVIYREYTQR